MPSDEELHKYAVDKLKELRNEEGVTPVTKTLLDKLAKDTAPKDDE